MYSFWRSWCFLLAIGHAAENQAADDSTLSEVLVSTPAANEIPSRLGLSTVLDRATLNSGYAADLNGALRGLGSVGLGQGNAGLTSNLILRGASGGLGLVTLDGVPLFNNFTSFFPLSHYPLDMLDSVGVTRGVGGERYGSRTLGGSINLFSRQLDDGRAFAHVEGGSYGTLRTNLGGGLRNELGNFTLAAGRSDIFQGVSQASPQNGNTEPKNFQLTNGLLHWNREFTRSFLDSSLYFVRSNDGMDGPGLLPSGKITWLNDPNGYLIQETWVAQTHGGYQVSDNWESSLRIGYTQDRQVGTIGNIFGQRFSMDLTSDLWMGHWENTHTLKLKAGALDAVRLTWGLDSQQQHAESPLNPAKVFALTNNVVSPLARAEIEWGDWQASSEMRFDHYDQFGDHAVFNFSSGWHPSADVKLWAKAGTGYRAPAVNERLHPLFGNPNLAPESNKGGELGWRWQLAPGAELSATGYFQRYDNLIVFQQVASGLISSANTPAANVWGSEWQASQIWNAAWSSGLSYTYMDARNAKTGLQIPARPENQGRFWTEWRLLEPVKLRVDLTYRDGYWSDPANTLRIQAAPRLNAKLEYQVDPKLRLYVRGENITDNRTPDLWGFNYVGAAVYAGGYLDW